MKRLLALILLSLISNAFSSTKFPDTEVAKLRSLSLDIRTIVLNFERINYSNAILKKMIPSSICTDFYNQIVKYERDKFVPYFNSSDYQTSVEVDSLSSMVDTSLRFAGACSYTNENELLKFEMYKELFDRDVRFSRYVLGD